MATNNAWNSENPAQVARGGTGRATITAHDIIVGNGTGAVGLVHPSVVSGIPVISQGVAADPVYGTAVVAGGGTGNTTFTPNSVIIGGTTSQNPLQSVDISSANAGDVLTYVGTPGSAGAPVWAASGGGGSGGGSYAFCVDATWYYQVIPVGGGDFTVPVDLVYKNNGSVWDVVNYRFTAPINGLYLFSAAATFSMAPDTNKSITLRLNVSNPTDTSKTLLAYKNFPYAMTNAVMDCIMLSGLIYLLASQRVTMIVNSTFADSSLYGATGGGQRTYISGCLISNL